MKRTIAIVAIVMFSGLFIPTSAIALTAEEFYSNAQKLDNINAFAATCQSAHETGFWTSPLWKKAMNGAGIKADKNWRKSWRMAVLHR